MRLQTPTSTSYSRRRRNVGPATNTYCNDEHTPISATMTIYEDGYRCSSVGGASDNIILRRHPPSVISRIFTRETFSSCWVENDDHQDSPRHRSHFEDTPHTPPKPPTIPDFLVSDACYQRYLIEGKRMEYRGIQCLSGGKLAVGEKDWHWYQSFLFKVSAVVSFVGMIFLVSVIEIVLCLRSLILCVYPKPMNCSFS